MTNLDKIKKLKRQNEQYNKTILMLVDWMAENLVEIKELENGLYIKEGEKDGFI